MEKSNAIVKVDTAANWEKAVNYIPDVFTIIVYEIENIGCQCACRLDSDRAGADGAETQEHTVGEAAIDYRNCG